MIHVTGTARDTQRYSVTRDASNHFPSFTVPPFYLDPRSILHGISSSLNLFALLLLLFSAFHGKRTMNTCSEFPPLFDLSLSQYPLSAPSLHLFLSVFFYFSPLCPLSRYSRGYCRAACFASDYYLPRSESTAGLWYTGSMVSRYTPATTAPSPRPLGEPVRSPAASRRVPPTASPVLRSPAVAVATALSSHHSPIRRTVLCRPSRAASTFCSRGSRDVSTVDLSECRFFFIGLTRQT